MKRAILLLALAASLACAQTASWTWEVGAMAVPTSATNVCSDTPGGKYPPCNKNLHLEAGVFVNTTGSAVTVTLTDNSLNCGGAACTLFSAAVAANTTYTVAFSGERANAGLLWSASATGVNAWLAGN